MDFHCQFSKQYILIWFIQTSSDKQCSGQMHTDAPVQSFSHEAVKFQIAQKLLHDVKSTLPMLYGISSALRSDELQLPQSTELNKFGEVLGDIQHGLQRFWNTHEQGGFYIGLCLSYTNANYDI